MSITSTRGDKAEREGVAFVPLADSEAGKQQDAPEAGGDDNYPPLSYSEALNKLKEHPCHPACAKFPLMGEDDLTAFAEDIRVRKQQEPIAKFEDKIADGRNRLVACLMAGVQPKFRDVQIEGSVTEWVSSKNIKRRHLTSGQRAVIAFDMLPVLKDEAKLRQKLSQGPGQKVAKDFAASDQRGKATEIAAKMLNTNATYVEKVKKIASTAPELIDFIRTGAIELDDASNIAMQLVQDRTGITTKRKRKERKSRKAGQKQGKKSAPAQPKPAKNLKDSAKPGDSNHEVQIEGHEDQTEGNEYKVTWRRVVGGVAIVTATDDQDAARMVRKAVEQQTAVEIDSDAHPLVEVTQVADADTGKVLAVDRGGDLGL